MRRGQTSQRKERRAAEPPQSIVTAKKWKEPVRAVSEAGIERIHKASLKLLSELGMEFMAPEAWDFLEPNGVIVDRETGVCKFPAEVLDEWVGKAPSRFVVQSRNPSLSLDIGGGDCYFAFGLSAPFVVDKSEPRRAGNTADFQRILKIAHSLNTVSTIGAYSSEPVDRPVKTRHLDCIYDFLTMTDKTYRMYPIGRTRAEDALDMAAIAFGIDRDQLSDAARMWSILSVNSPLKLDAELLRGAISMAKAGQAQVVSPVCFAGAMSPITMSGALVQANAEALATIAFLQMVRPGAPVFYGVLISPTDMRSGAPQMGAAEAHLATLAASQLARYYNLPRRATNGCSTCGVDAQAGYETALSLMSIFLSGADLVFASHGLIESLLLFSYEKAIVDHEVIRMICRMSDGLDLSDIDEALAAIESVGPGGHFFGTDHTLKRYDNAVLEPVLSEWSSFEAWELNGSLDAEERAHRLWKKMVGQYEPPPISEDRQEALRELVSRRTEEILRQS